MKPMISIIVPVYNADKYLAKCLDSLASQTYRNIEVLLIDDGSNDKSAEICKAYAEHDLRFKYFYQDNQGVSSARNYGLDLAKGEYVGFCDSDDWVEPDLYEFLFDMITENDADISICSVYSDSDLRIDKPHLNEVKARYTSEEAIIEMHKGTNFAGHLWNKLFRRAVIDGLRLDKNIHIFEDMLFTWMAFHNSSLIVFHNAKKYHYMQYFTSCSHSYRETFWSIQDACLRMYDMMKQYYPENLDYAKRTILSGNLLLARIISEAKKLKKEKYNKILEEIKEYSTEKAIEVLKKDTQKELRIFTRSRVLYNLYIMKYIIKKIPFVRRTYLMLFGKR